MKPRWSTTLLLVLAAFALGGWLVSRPAAADGDVYQRARLFEQVLGTIHTHAVDSTSEGKLYDEATQGLVKSLHDPYAELLTGDGYRQYRATMEGVATSRGLRWPRPDRESGWLGAETPPAPHQPAVSAPVMLDSAIGYVALHTMSRAAAGELAAAVDSLRGQGMKSLVLDLRRNPGGLISEGVQVADLFLGVGDTIAVTRGRIREHSSVYVDRTPQRWPNLPVVVLVNRGTASSAELITTALQDHDRAAIVGTPTFGKGVVQTTFPLGREVALKITTSRWYGPSGRTIQRPLTASDSAAPDTERRSSGGRALPEHRGVVPDVVVRATALTPPDRAFLRTLGGDLGRYQEALTATAGRVADATRLPDERFRVTSGMRAAFRSELSRNGVEVADSTLDESDMLERDIGYAIARERFGEPGELRRRSIEDRQVRAAVRLLLRIDTPAELVERVTKDADANEP